MFKKITREKLDLFLKQYATEVKVLDVGSGGSLYDRYFPNRVSIDIDPLRKPDFVADAHDLPFKDGEFEFILCTEVLEHLRDPKLAILEMNRVLNNGGMFVLTTRFVYPIHDSPNDYWRFTKYGLEELFKNWEIVELIPETETFSAIAVLLQRISFQSKLHLNKLVKLTLFALAYIFNHLDFLIKKEFGDIKKETLESQIMTTGYYLVAKKK